MGKNEQKGINEYENLGMGSKNLLAFFKKFLV